MAVWLTLTLVTALLPAQSTPAPSTLTVSTRLNVPAAGAAIGDELQLLEDPRITPALQKDLWDTGNLVDRLPDARNAEVRLVKPDGTVADTLALERPLAQLERARLYGSNGRDTFLITVDYGAGAGSYAGPVTFLLEVSDGRLTWLEARDHATARSERITLMRSLKSTWQFVPASEGGGQDILQALCRPTPAAVRSDAVRFVTTYRRYHFDGQTWIRLSRAVDGLSEFDTDTPFPARNLFP